MSQNKRKIVRKSRYETVNKGSLKVEKLEDGVGGRNVFVAVAVCGGGEDVMVVVSGDFDLF